MTVLYAIIALIVAAVIVAKLYLCIAGKEKIVVKTDAPFVVADGRRNRDLEKTDVCQ